jgi:predicted phage terminase large subunit-like protein
LIQSDWYQSRWADRFEMTEDQNAKDFYQNTKMGFREIVSIGGSSTGRRAKFRLIDDAIDAMGALSNNVIENTNEWYDTAFSSRFEDPKDNRLIAVAQRLAESDLMGHLMELHPEADVICLPARYESSHPVKMRSSLGKTDWRKKDGELLFPERYGEAEQSRIESQSSDFVIASQQQQRPDPKGGNVVHDEWWHYYDRIPAGIARRIIYADTAQKVGDANDWTVFQCWGLVPNKGIFLLDQFREKVESPELRAMAKAFWDKHRKPYASTPAVSVMKVEDKSSGTSLIQELKRLDRVNIVGIPRPAGSGKANRMIDFSPKIKDGFVFLPSGPTELTDASWVSDYIKEFRQFRLDMSHAHDDMIDPTLDAIDDLLLGSEKTQLAAGLYGRR